MALLPMVTYDRVSERKIDSTIEVSKLRGLTLLISQELGGRTVAPKHDVED